MTHTTLDAARILRENPYPGRGILLGVAPDGKRSVAVYFIMGRSVNSRNRIFLPEPDGIRTQAWDASKMTDPSLIIYHPVRQRGRELIVTNGDQTDTIRDCLLRGGTFAEALRTREFEPDGPNWTPRISGLLSQSGSYRLSILKSADGVGSACVRQFFEYPAQPGIGHLLHTYECDGDPLPSFCGEPRQVEVPDDMDCFAKTIWGSLNEDNKVSLFMRYTDMESGEAEQIIINKNQ